MQQKYELGTRLNCFWHKNKKKISLNSIFCIRAPKLFIIKICFTNKINTICGRDQLLVSGSQGPISRVPNVRFPCPRIQGSDVEVPGSQVPGLRVPGLRVLGPGSLVLILDYALGSLRILNFFLILYSLDNVMEPTGFVF